MNTATASFNTTVRQMTEMSQRKKTGLDHDVDWAFLLACKRHVQQINRCRRTSAANDF